MDVLPNFHLQGLTKIKDFQSVSSPSNPLKILDFVCKPAFTEAAFVSRHSDAFAAAAMRVDEGLMEVDTHHDLHRSPSHVSNSSKSSQRSQTLRGKPRKHSSYASSTTSSRTASDKSLTSFPSFSPDRKSPKVDRSFKVSLSDGTAQTIRRASGPQSSIVDDLIAASPSRTKRNALFDDELFTIRQVPGAIHLANDEHIGRLIARNGAVALVRQIAEDLAQRDSQIAVLRRKADERERALRKIVRECGLSNLDLETRLRTIEDESRTNDDTSLLSNNDGDGLEDLIHNAMAEAMHSHEGRSSENLQGGATIRASDHKLGAAGKQSKDTVKGWKDYIWGGNTSKKSSTASSINGNADKGSKTVIVNGGKAGGRRTVLQNDVFQPPEAGLFRSSSRASSIQSGHISPDRKTSLATLALKFVAGNGAGGKEVETSSTSYDGANNDGERVRGRSASSKSSRPLVLVKGAKPKQSLARIPSPRRTTVTAGTTLSGMSLTTVQDRWDTMGMNPQSTASIGVENSGPVEMDAILPLEAQPPTLTTVYKNHHNPEFLTDRFGFIYDQRRKKRQREAADTMQKIKRGDRYEGLNSARGGLSTADEEPMADVFLDMRPDTPASINAEDAGDGNKTTKRWQDYLKIATFPTELLSHTPLRSVPGIEVLEADDVVKAPSPGFKTEERGFVPASTIAAPPVSVVPENATTTTATSAPFSSDLTKDDLEPVKLLLEQLGEVHDALQREKTIKWNDFLRKVRAERKREGEAAAAAAEARSQRGMAVMPEATMTDGEMIGVAGLGNKGKVGRAKWSDFKTLLLGGIPVSYRAKIWAECSGAAALRVPGYYDDLIARREEDDDPVIVAQIKMDINRTLTDNIFFRRGPGVTKLNEVLIAYSRRNPEVGYCQGMNLITACLLLIMPAAEDAFWILTSMIENILPEGYYDHSLLSSRADQQVLRQYVAAILPRLSAHLDALSIELEALTFQWFLSVFTDCLSAEALFRVWDVVLCTNDGSTFLFEVALALLKLNERQLLQCQSPASVYTYINHQMTNHAISIDGLIHASEGLRKVVKREDIETRRDKAIRAEKDLARQREVRNSLRKKERAAVGNLNGDVIPSGSAPGNLDVVSRAAETGAVSRVKSLKAGRQLDLDMNGLNDLTIRAPMAVEEDRQMAVG